MAARHEEGCYKTKIFTNFSFAFERLTNDDVGVATGTALQEIPPGTGLKTVDFVKEKLGGLP